MGKGQVGRWVDGLVHGSVGSWLDGWVRLAGGGWAHGCIGVGLSEQVDEKEPEWVGKWT